VRQGKADETSLDGTVIDFIYVDNVRQGYARKINPDGVVEEFTYVDGNAQGKSRHTLPCGSVCELTIVDGMPVGKARMISQDGTVTACTNVDGKNSTMSSVVRRFKKDNGRYAFMGDCRQCLKQCKRLKVCTCFACSGVKLGLVGFRRPSRKDGVPPHLGLYCSRACQREAWPEHRKNHDDMLKLLAEHLFIDSLD